MKRITILASLLMLPFMIQAQDFKKYGSMKDVNSMIMTSEMFKLLADIDVESDDADVKRYQNLIENLQDIKVISTEKPAIGLQMKEDVNLLIKNSSLSELMHINNEGKQVDFYSVKGSKKGYVSKLVMFLQTEEGGKPLTVVLSISGDIDLSEVSKLAEDLKVPGADELKKVEDQ